MRGPSIRGFGPSVVSPYLEKTPTGIPAVAAVRAGATGQPGTRTGCTVAAGPADTPMTTHSAGPTGTSQRPT